MRGYNVLSLFGGIECGRVALERAGIPVANYFSSEIDKHAIRVTTVKHPEIKHLGDVRGVRANDLPFIPDILIGGSPCQGFSMAGKRLNLADPRSALFFEFVRIMKECQTINPNVKFMLENVPMDKRVENIITEQMGIRPYKSDAALVGPQRRVRTFWTNIKTKKVGLFGEEVPDIPQPKDRGIFVRDILQENVPEKYRVTGKRLEYMLASAGKYTQLNGEKSHTFLAKSDSGWQGDLIEETGFYQTGRGENPGGFSAVKKSPTFGANSCEHNQHILSFPCQMRRTDEGRKIRKAVESGQITARRDEQMAYLPNRDGKSGTYTLKADDNLLFVHEKAPCFHGFEHGSNGAYEGLVLIKDKAGCYTAGGNSAGNHSQTDLVPDGPYFRRYTPVEVCRLFGLPDDYFFDRNGNQIVSESQQYRLMGNGWQVDQVAHIFSFLPELS